ncbi:MAG: ankyrin repeat domain-containing protein [Planctomycetota bacterium]|jgi:ankyrin repeat protein
MKKHSFVLLAVIMLVSGGSLARSGSDPSYSAREPTFTPSTFIDIGASLATPDRNLSSFAPNESSDSEEAMFATYSFSNDGTTYNIEFYYREHYGRIRTRVLIGEREMRGLFNRFYGVDGKRPKMLSVSGRGGVLEVSLNFGWLPLTESDFNTEAVYDIAEEHYAHAYPKHRNANIRVSRPPGMLKETYRASLGRIYLVSEEGHVDPFTLENLRVAYNREKIKAENQEDYERIGRSLLEAWDAPNNEEMVVVSDVNEIPGYSRHPLDSESEKKVTAPRNFTENGIDYWVCSTYRRHLGIVFQYRFGFQKGEVTSLDELVLGRNVGDSYRVLSPGAYVKRQAVTPTGKYYARKSNKVAEGRGIEQIRSLVAAGAVVNAKQRFGYTPLHYAAWDGNRKMVERLIDKGAAVNAATWLGDTPLHSACERHRTGIAELLISKGANVNAKGNYGRTPLHHAAWLGNKDLVALLLANGANVNSEEEHGNTPLHGAAQQNYTDVARVLVSGGAKIDSGNRGGYPPLHWAVERDHKDMAEFLIASGAGVNTSNKHGQTLLHEAAMFGARNAAEVLLDNGADINRKDNGGKTALRDAIFWHHENLAQFLIARGADIKGEDRDGETLLRVAADRGSHALVKLLISKGADVNTQNIQGETPLHEAAKYGREEMVKLLLAHGADVQAKAKTGQTPLDLAEAKDRTEIVRLLNAANGP